MEIGSLSGEMAQEAYQVEKAPGRPQEAHPGEMAIGRP